MAEIFEIKGKVISEMGKKKVYQKLMCLGASCGCHQMPERSFFIKGRQFPICARCTGVIIGNIAAYILFFLCAPPPELCVMGCAVMFTDWFIQYIGICPSTNIRRLITGIIGGGSLATIYCMAIEQILQILIQNRV